MCLFGYSARKENPILGIEGQMFVPMLDKYFTGQTGAASSAAP